MKYIYSVTVAVFLTAFCIHSMNAQVSQLTNADVIQFVKGGMPEQAVITLVAEAIEAKAIRFDLSAAAVAELATRGVPPSVITAMRQQPKTAVVLVAPSTVEVPARKPLPLGVAEIDPKMDASLAALAAVDRTKFARIQAAGMALRMSEVTVAPSKIASLLKTFKTEIDAVRAKATTEGEKDLLHRYQMAQTMFTVGLYGMHTPGNESESYPSIEEARSQIDFIQDKVFGAKTGGLQK